MISMYVRYTHICNRYDKCVYMHDASIHIRLASIMCTYLHILLLLFFFCAFPVDCSDE